MNPSIQTPPTVLGLIEQPYARLSDGRTLFIAYCAQRGFTTTDSNDHTPLEGEDGPCFYPTVEGAIEEAQSWLDFRRAASPFEKAERCLLAYLVLPGNLVEVGEDVVVWKGWEWPNAFCPKYISTCCSAAPIDGSEQVDEAGDVVAGKCSHCQEGSSFVRADEEDGA